MTQTAYAARDVANIIRSQIQVGVFMSLGASDLRTRLDTETNESGLSFTARIAPKGQSRVRLMTVKIMLNALDYYDITVTYQPKRYGPFVTHAEFSNVDVFSLNGVLLGLDS